jgi:hypothetical protein
MIYQIRFHGELSMHGAPSLLAVTVRNHSATFSAPISTNVIPKMTKNFKSYILPLRQRIKPKCYEAKLYNGCALRSLRDHHNVSDDLYLFIH